MVSNIDFLTHPLIGQNCVPAEGVISRYARGDGSPTSTARVGTVGSMVMVKPDPEANPNHDAAWFGVLTWIQPEEEVTRRRPRLCEIWWVYTRKHLIDAVKASEAGNKKTLLQEIKRFSKKQAFVSDHFSDEPLDSIITFPKSNEVSNRIKLSRRQYVKIDVENDVYELAAL